MKMACCRNKQAFDPDSGWHAKETEMLSNPMYKLMDHNMGGMFIQVFKEQGHDGVRRLCASHLQNPFLYSRSGSHVITHSEYAQWRADLDLKSDNSSHYAIMKDYSEDPLIKFQEHKACWSLSKRGVLGETILHLCYHNDTPIHTEIAKILLNMYPNLALDIIEGEEYYGQSALHLAIVNGDFDSVKLLVENGANVNQRATGKFFLPEDHKKKNKKKTEYSGYAYYGEYPLSFAACFGHEAIYDYLVQHGADPNNQDSYGNTVLHMVVIHNRPDMYSHAVRHPIKAANAWLKNGADNNKEQLTPLALASKLGRQHIFNEILEQSRVELWRFSNICCSLFPLYAIDSIGIGGKTNWNSALMIIVNGDTEDHLEMLQGGVVKQLLDEKWKSFARRLFLQRLIFIALHLLLLTLAICLRPHHDLITLHEAKDGIRFACEILVVIFCTTNLLLHVNEVKALGIYLFLVNLKNAPPKAVFLLSCFLILFCVPVRFTHFLSEDESFHLTLQLIEESMLIFAVPFAWCMLLFFAGGTSLTGTSVMMFYKILIGDLVRFVLIYLIFVAGFGLAFNFLYKDVRDPSIVTFLTFGGSLMSVFHMTFGEFAYIDFDFTAYPELTKIVFMIFMLFVPILLLNMFIAMMGNTYISIVAKSEKEFIRQWAKIVLVLERSFSRKRLQIFQNQYSLAIDNPPKADIDYMRKEHGEKTEYRALMVIKTTSKTMAKQRKGAISNWKWMLKETVRRIKDIKQSGYRGEINYVKVFSTGNEFTLYENALNKSISGIKKRSSGLGGVDFADADWTSAVEQLAWEKDLNLSSSGVSLPLPTIKPPTPLDRIDTPPEIPDHPVTNHSIETNLAEFIDDAELEAIIQQASEEINSTNNQHSM